MKRLLKLLLASLILAGCSEKSPPQEMGIPAVPVRTAEISLASVPFYFEEMGIITPYQIAEVKPQVTGLVTGVHFKEGDQVLKGDLLYTIEESLYAIKVQEAEALVTHDLANLQNVEKKLERYKSLSKQDLIAKVEWDELETKVELCKALVKGDEAKLAAAKLDLEHCRICAPLSGRTGKTALRAGNRADASSALVTLVQEKPLYVDFAITEKELQLLPSETPLFEIYAAGGEECLATGTLTFLDHTIDPKSGLLSVRGVLSDPYHKSLRAGQSVRVHLFFGRKDQAKLIPLKAIKTNQLGSYVFSVKEDDTVEMRTVKLGPEERGMIVVEEGLEDAVKVVIEGHSRLFPGSKVEEIH